MRLAPISLLTFLLVLLPVGSSRAFTDAELIDGFMRTVFGSEFPAWNSQAGIVKKYTRPVRVFVDDRSRERRGPDVEAFVRSLPRLIADLDVSVVSSASAANYHIFVLDRADYGRVVSREVYRRPYSTYAPGKCVVRITTAKGDITHSDAAIVADEGEPLFRRCMVEEVLQGLGPANDDASLAESVFNDTSQHTTFTSFDRHILNVLYHPAIRPGMNEDEARGVLPWVVAEVRARLR